MQPRRQNRRSCTFFAVRCSSAPHLSRLPRRRFRKTAGQNNDVVFSHLSVSRRDGPIPLLDARKGVQSCNEPQKMYTDGLFADADAGKPAASRPHSGSPPAAGRAQRRAPRTPSREARARGPGLRARPARTSGPVCARRPHHPLRARAAKAAARRGLAPTPRVKESGVRGDFFRLFELSSPIPSLRGSASTLSNHERNTQRCSDLGFYKTVSPPRRRGAPQDVKESKKIASKPDPADARPRSAPERDREGASIVASGRPSAPGARRAGATGRAASAQRRARTRNPQKSASGGSGQEFPPARLARVAPRGVRRAGPPAGRPAYGRKPRRVRGVRRGRARQPLAAIGAGSARPAPSGPSAGPMSARQSMANGWALRRLCAMRARRGRRARGARRTEKARIVARISTCATRSKQ